MTKKLDIYNNFLTLFQIVLSNDLILLYTILLYERPNLNLYLFVRKPELAEYLNKIPAGYNLTLCLIIGFGTNYLFA